MRHLPLLTSPSLFRSLLCWDFCVTLLYCHLTATPLSLFSPPKHPYSAPDFSLPPVRRGTHHPRPSSPRSCASSCSGVIAALAVMTDSTTLRTCTTLSTVFLATYHYYVFSFRRPLGNACRSFPPLLAPFAHVRTWKLEVSVPFIVRWSESRGRLFPTECFRG